MNTVVVKNFFDGPSKPQKSPGRPIENHSINQFSQKPPNSWLVQSKSIFTLNTILNLINERVFGN